MSRLDSLEHAKQVILNAWGNWQEGGKQVLQETNRVIIATIKGEPG